MRRRDHHVRFLTCRIFNLQYGPLFCIGYTQFGDLSTRSRVAAGNNGLRYVGGLLRCITRHRSLAAAGAAEEPA